MSAEPRCQCLCKLWHPDSAKNRVRCHEQAATGLHVLMSAPMVGQVRIPMCIDCYTHV